MTAGAARATVVAGSFAACLAGVLGTDGGLLWVVAGVFTIRSIAGSEPGLAWGVACLGAGLRWGTLGIGDIQAATRLLGATVATGAPVVRAGMLVALLGALADEARHGLLKAPWIEQGATAAAVVALVPLFIVAGPERLQASAAAWGLAGLGALAAVVVAHPFVKRLPWWVPLVMTSLGVVAAEVGG